ncbi:Thioredoxin-like fold [Phytophthora cactorum]|nr:Thioredoxin-like fold [Phytophthora cactorum]
MGRRAEKYCFRMDMLNLQQESCGDMLLSLLPAQLSLLDFQKENTLRCSKYLTVAMFLFLQHPYILPVMDIYYSKEKKALLVVQPFLSNGSIKDRIYQVDSPAKPYDVKYRLENAHPLPFEEIAKFSRQILEALAGLRSKGLVCDHLRSTNVVIDGGNAKVAEIFTPLLAIDRYKDSRELTVGLEQHMDIDLLLFGQIFHFYYPDALSPPEPELSSEAEVEKNGSEFDDSASVSSIVSSRNKKRLFLVDVEKMLDDFPLFAVHDIPPIRTLFSGFRLDSAMKSTIKYSMRINASRTQAHIVHYNDQQALLRARQRAERRVYEEKEKQQQRIQQLTPSKNPTSKGNPYSSKTIPTRRKTTMSLCVLNEPAPDMTLTDLETGEQKQLLDLVESSGKYTILTFYATWSKASEREVETMEIFSKDRHNKLLNFVLVNLDQNIGDTFAFLDTIVEHRIGDEAIKGPRVCRYYGNGNEPTVLHYGAAEVLSRFQTQFIRPLPALGSANVANSTHASSREALANTGPTKPNDTGDEPQEDTRKAAHPTVETASTNPFKPNNRKCTDVLCLLFFVVFWIGMIIIAGVGYKHGKPQRLIYGTDWMGRTCGAQAGKTDTVPAYDFTDYKYMIYPRLSEDLKALAAAGYSAKQLVNPSTLRKLFGVCVPSCPLITDKDLYVHAYLDYTCTSLETTKEERQIGSTTEDPVTELLSRKWYMVARWLGDLQKAAFPILICGGLFALILGLIWLVMLRYCAGLFVWLVIVLVVAMQIVITFFCAYEGNLINSTSMQSSLNKMGMSSEDAQALTAATTTYITSAGITAAEDQARYWAIACYVLTAIDILLLLLLIFMCGRIRIAIGIIREASKALQSMPMLTLYPIIPTLFAENDTMHYLMIYHLFGLLWTSQFIQAAAYATIAGAFCEYYWTLDKRQVPARPVFRSMWRTIRYHFGSVAFGSLIIAVVQMFRIALEYIDQKMRAAKQGNAVVKVAMMCLKCFLWCFEKCLKFLNKNAFIIMAMKGRSFCPAMKDSFSLLLANAARVATVSIVSRFLMILGKLFITGFCMLFMFVFIRYPPTHLPSFFMGDLASVSSPIFPMLLTGVLSYATASFFLDIYGTGIDTILLCFCEDCNVNKTSEQYYMSDELVAFIEGPAKHNAFPVYQKQGSNTRDSAAATAPPIVQTGPMTKIK